MSINGFLFKHSLITDYSVSLPCQVLRNFRVEKVFSCSRRKGGILGELQTQKFLKNRKESRFDWRKITCIRDSENTVWSLDYISCCSIFLFHMMTCWSRESKWLLGFQTYLELGLVSWQQMQVSFYLLLTTFSKVQVATWSYWKVLLFQKYSQHVKYLVYRNN